MLECRTEHRKPFKSTGLHPLLAYCNENGDRSYIGRVYCPYTCPSCGVIQGRLELCAVAEDMKPEDLRILVNCCQQKALLVPEYMSITCLRYSPSAYPHPSIESCNASETLDATGPFSWKPVQLQTIHASRKELEYRRVISVEEAVSLKDVPLYDKDGLVNLSDSDTEEGGSNVEELFESVHTLASEESNSPKEGGMDIESDTGSVDTDFFSFVEEADMAFQSPAAEIKPEGWPHDAPMTCSGRTDTGTIQQPPQLTPGGIDVQNEFETSHAGKDQLLESLSIKLNDHNL